ncbi:MAG: benzoate/H(+) symporter BenE family transporter [Hyphomicrobiales bacterium]
MTASAPPAPAQGGFTASLAAAALAAVVVGFSSTILVVIEGLRAVGAGPAEQASGAAILCYGMALLSLVLAVLTRKPIIVAWSTPGAALLASSGGHYEFAEAVGAFIMAGGLMLLTGLLRPLERAIEAMPAAIASAMLAGVLFHYVLNVPAAALSSPLPVLTLALLYFVFRLWKPLFAVPLVVVAGLVMAFATGGLSVGDGFAVTPLVFTAPTFNVQALLGIGLPLYLVTMASQNLPGFAVLRASGYEPPVRASLMTTALGSIVAAPFGSHALNLAAITASLVASPEAHPDPTQRWKMIYLYAPLYLLIGLGAGVCVTLLGHLPKDLVTAIAGLALFGPLLGGVAAMAKDARDIEAALVTFVVTASGISLAGVGAAFWGLMAGLVLWAAKRLLKV